MFSRAARCHDAAQQSANKLEPVSDFVKERLRLTPRHDQVYQCGDGAHKHSLKREMRPDAPAYPYCKDEWQDQGGDKNGRQESPLPKEVEHRENNGEDP
jgi:hypothetical protein